jgi:pimeloyl-ACP methyl ester carboxylesterase
MKALINGIQLAYDDVGEGLPVLWIHGYPLDRSVWSRQVSGLGSGLRHIVPDLRGFGQSDAPETGYPMELYAADLAALLDLAGVDQAVVAGLSMGGYIALAFARVYPDRLRALILCDTRAGPDSSEARANREAGARRALAEGVRPVVEPLIPKLLAPGTPPELVDSVRQMLLASRPAGVAGALRGMAMRSDASPGLSAIAVPTLVVVGAEDELMPVTEARAMADAIPDAELVVVPDAGHLAPLEQPEAVNRAVRAFLDRLQASP